MKKRNKLWLIIPVIIPIFCMALFKNKESTAAFEKRADALPYEIETISLQKDYSFKNNDGQREETVLETSSKELIEDTEKKTVTEKIPSSDFADKGTEDLQYGKNTVSLPANNEKIVQAEKSGDKTESMPPESTAVKEPQHVHDWIPVTETVHHDAEYRTVHHDAVTEEVKVTDSQAWTENIYRDWCVCNECGYMAESYSELDQHFWDSHDYECSGYHTETVLEKTVEHPEEWHYETRTVSEAYDEQVLVKQAYDETVTTGYKCATCGERK